MTVAGFATALKLIKIWYIKKQENERLEKERLLAVLQVLKSQLHPHFMFNTLNSIYSLALTKSNATADAILKLSSLLRYMLTECTNPVILLATEIQILKNYIDLEKNRFGSRFDISVNIQGDVNGKKIAPLLLLPFVENAFKHGSNEMLEQAWMSLDLIVEDQELQMKLINGKTSYDGVQPSSGIGLQNVQKRLKLMYPQSHELRIREHEDTFIVTLSLQLNKIIIQEHENSMFVGG
jgi:LytS/YehU family sensor histidine kinase